MLSGRQPRPQLARLTARSGLTSAFLLLPEFDLGSQSQPSSGSLPVCNAPQVRCLKSL